MTIFNCIGYIDALRTSIIFCNTISACGILSAKLRCTKMSSASVMTTSVSKPPPPGSALTLFLTLIFLICDEAMLYL